MIFGCFKLNLSSVPQFDKSIKEKYPLLLESIIKVVFQSKTICTTKHMIIDC